MKRINPPISKCPRNKTTTKKTKNKHRLHFSEHLCTPPVGSCVQFCSQRLVCSTMSELEPRLSSAMWYKAGSGWSESCDWLVWAFLSRDWTIAWRRQVIHCCLLKESLACRLYGWALERPLLLTRKQFFTGKKTKRRKLRILWTSEPNLYNSNNTSLCSVTVSVGQHWCVTFIVSSCKSSSEGSSSTSLSIWDLLQIY